MRLQIHKELLAVHCAQACQPHSPHCCWCLLRWISCLFDDITLIHVLLPVHKSFIVQGKCTQGSADSWWLKPSIVTTSLQVAGIDFLWCVALGSSLLHRVQNYFLPIMPTIWCLPYVDFNPGCLSRISLYSLLPLEVGNLIDARVLFSSVWSASHSLKLISAISGLLCGKPQSSGWISNDLIIYTWILERPFIGVSWMIWNCVNPLCQWTCQPVT